MAAEASDVAEVAARTAKERIKLHRVHDAGGQLEIQEDASYPLRKEFCPPRPGAFPRL